MNKKQKDFILNKLCPTILREHGRGFGMNQWLEAYRPGCRVRRDGITRKVPKCGTVACIGGTLDMLTGRCMSSEVSGKMIGLTPKRASALFYLWDTGTVKMRHAWPMKFQKSFKRAKTPLGKAKVAVRLLHEIVATNGKCMDVKNQ